MNIKGIVFSTTVVKDQYHTRNSWMQQIRKETLPGEHGREEPLDILEIVGGRIILVVNVGKDGPQSHKLRLMKWYLHVPSNDRRCYRADHVLKAVLVVRNGKEVRVAPGSIRRLGRDLPEWSIVVLLVFDHNLTFDRCHGACRTTGARPTRTAPDTTLESSPRRSKSGMVTQGQFASCSTEYEAMFMANERIWLIMTSVLFVQDLESSTDTVVVLSRTMARTTSGLGRHLYIPHWHSSLVDAPVRWLPTVTAKMAIHVADGDGRKKRPPG